MTDTPPAVEKLYRELLLARSGVERLKMGAAMFDAARALVLSSLTGPTGTAGSADARMTLLLRFYGRDLDARTIAGIARRLEAGGSDLPQPGR